MLDLPCFFPDSIFLLPPVITTNLSFVFHALAILCYSVMGEFLCKISFFQPYKYVVIFLTSICAVAYSCSSFSLYSKISLFVSPQIYLCPGFCMFVFAVVDKIHYRFICRLPRKLVRIFLGNTHTHTHTTHTQKWNSFAV